MSNKIKISITIIIVILIVWIIASKGENPASQNAPIKIGISTALTGPAAFVGGSYFSGLKQAQEEINAQGGIHGQQVELIVEDNKNNAQEGITAFRSIETKKPDLFISTMSVPTVPVTPVVKESGIPQFVSLVFADMTSKNENSVSFFPTADDDVHATMQDMTLHKVKNVGVIYINSEYGQASLSAFLKQAKDNNINVIAQESFLDGALDYLTPLTKINASKPDAVFIIAVNAIPIIKQLKAVKTNSLIYTTMTSAFGNLVNKDKETFEGVHVTASRVSIPGTDDYIRLRSTMKNAVATSTLGYDALGYDSMYVIKAVLEKNPDAKDFVKTFANYGPFQGVNGSFNLNSRNIGMTLYPVVMKNGVLGEVK